VSNLPARRNQKSPVTTLSENIERIVLTTIIAAELFSQTTVCRGGLRYKNRG
jgi:hypothetical protein